VFSVELAMRDVLNPWANPVTWAVPFFLLSIGIELAALKWLDHDEWQPASAGLPRSSDAEPASA
jgi:hypothetical protein